MPAAPKFEPRRTNPRVGPMVLPSCGRQGDPPPWPIGRGTKAELAVWADLWVTPQAHAWDHLGWSRVVARYVRLLLAAERLDKTALGEARQLEDRLGLTPKAMRLMLWTIGEFDEPAVDDSEADTLAEVHALHAVS